MPLGSLAGTRLTLSYAVFFAAAILIAVVLTMAARPGNVDLTRAAAIGVGFWIAGWIAQAATHFALTRSFGLAMPQLNIGLIGVESEPRDWSASRTLLISVGAVASLLLLGCFFRLVEGGFQIPVLSPTSTQTWSVPSLGFTAHDSIWRSGAWLCWLQAIFQMYPLPRSMGRQTIGALTFICSRKLELPAQTVIFRRCLVAVAVLTVLSSILLSALETQSSALKWPLVLLIGVFLAVTSHATDVPEILAGFRSPLADRRFSTDTSAAPPRGRKRGMLSSIRFMIESRRQGRRIRMAHRKERSEAIDAVRLDEILNRLHRDGIDSLGVEDRKILDRVSKNLRNQRRSESEPPDEPD